MTRPYFDYLKNKWIDGYKPKGLEFSNLMDQLNDMDDVETNNKELLQEVLQGEFDEAALQTDFQNKLEAAEATYAPRLTTLENEVVEINEKIENVESDYEHRIEELEIEIIGIDDKLGEKANISYVNEKVQAANLAYKESYLTLYALQVAYPNGDEYNHVVLEDGMIYTWHNNLWTNTQIQANGTGIAKDSVTLEKVNLPNIYKYENIIASRNINVIRTVISTGSGAIRTPLITSNFVHKETTYFIYVEFTLEKNDTIGGDIQVALKESNAAVKTGTDATLKSKIKNDTGVQSFKLYGKINYNSSIELTNAIIYLTVLGTTNREFEIAINKLILIEDAENLSNEELSMISSFYGEQSYLPIPNIPLDYNKKVVNDSDLKEGSTLNNSVEYKIKEVVEKVDLPNTKKYPNIIKEKNVEVYTNSSFSTSGQVYSSLVTNRITHKNTEYFVYLDLNLKKFDNVGGWIYAGLKEHNAAIKLGTDATLRRTMNDLGIGTHNVKLYGKIPYTSNITDMNVVAHLTSLGTGARNFEISVNKVILMEDTEDISTFEIMEFLENQDFRDYLYVPSLPFDYEEKVVNSVEILEGSVLENSIINIIDNNKIKKDIVCWGDSLTAGAGGGGTSYPSVLQTLIPDKTVVNMGIGGETSRTIMGRNGSLPFIVQPFNIPATTTAVQVSLTSADGLNVEPLVQASTGINPCNIAGVEGSLSRNNNQYYFTRSVAGNAVNVTTYEPIITNASKLYRNHVLCLFMGQNGGFTDFDNLIQQHRYAIDYLTSSNKEYVIIGLTTQTAAYRGAYDSAMLKAFGRRFINARDYLSKYGIAEAGLTPTQEDLEYMADGRVPPSLLSDSIHLNSHGYTVLAEVVYKRLKEFSII